MVAAGGVAVDKEKEFKVGEQVHFMTTDIQGYGLVVDIIEDNDFLGNKYKLYSSFYGLLTLYKFNLQKL